MSDFTAASGDAAGDEDQRGAARAFTAPLTPWDCDLRGLPWVPMDVDELREGGLAMLPDAEARWAGIQAIAAAWRQVPAASLPDDDAALTYLTGYGRDVATWQAARAAGALVGWLSCSDGRLYHPGLAAHALDAWQARQKRQAAGAKGNAKRWGSRPDGGAIADGSQCDRNAMAGGSQLDRNAVAPAIADRESEREKEKQGKKEEASPSAQRAREKGSRLPLDWQPSADDVAYAQGLGLDWRRVAEDFRGYWLAKAGKDAVKVDWSLTWQGWCRREADRNGGSRPRGVPAAAKPDRYAATALALGLTGGGEIVAFKPGRTP